MGLRDTFSDVFHQVTSPVKTAINQGIGVFSDATDNTPGQSMYRKLPVFNGVGGDYVHAVSGELANGYKIAGNNLGDARNNALQIAAPVLNPVLDKILGPVPAPDPAPTSADNAQVGPFGDNDPNYFSTNKPIFSPPGVLAPGVDSGGGGGGGGGTSTSGYADAIRKFFGGGGNASLGAYGSGPVGANRKGFPWVPVLLFAGVGGFLFLRKRIK